MVGYGVKNFCVPATIIDYSKLVRIAASLALRCSCWSFTGPPSFPLSSLCPEILQRHAPADVDASVAVCKYTALTSLHPCRIHFRLTSSNSSRTHTHPPGS